MKNTRTQLSALLASAITTVFVAACGVGEYDPEFEDLAVDDDQALSTTTLFGDAYATGWSPSWSWNSGVGTSSLAHSGTKSIAWTPRGAWAGLYLHSHTGVHTKGFSSVTLAIRAPKSGMKIGVNLYDGNNKSCGKKVVLSSPPAGAWKVYTLALSSLNGTDRLIKGITITEQNGSAQPTVYVDAVRLIGSDGTSTSEPAPAPAPSAEPTPGLSMDERFDSSMTISYGVPGTHPTYFLEWNGLIPPKVSNGVLSVVGNSHRNAYKGYHRGFSKVRYGGVGKATVFRARVRMTKAYTDSSNGTYTGIKLGMKFPRDASITGYSKDDPRSVAGTSQNSPASIITVMGIGPAGRLEVARNVYGPEGYLSFPSAKFVPYTTGTWKDVTIRIDQTPGPNLRVRIWHSAGHDMSASPVYEFSGAGVSDDKGFIWFRNDFADFEYDYISVQELAL